MAIYPWTSGTWQQLLGRRENLPQALLIHGPRGIGKLELARQFAQLVLCETAGSREPCGRCDGCRWFQAGQHPDFRQVEPESLAAPVESSEDAPVPSKTAKPSQEIKVDQVRELVDFLNIGSHRGKRRLVIFHPAEAMNANAANSLLKSLEDPASGACFILVSNNARHLIPTIRSRCISVAVSLPEEATALAWLAQESVADGAQWLRFSGGAPLLARECASSPRGEKIDQVIELLRKGGREALHAWPATDREQIEILAEVLQKWAMDQVLGSFSGMSKYFPSPGSARKRKAPPHAWLNFAREVGRYRIAAQHPLNPKLFAVDLISRIPE